MDFSQYLVSDLLSRPGSHRDEDVEVPIRLASDSVSVDAVAAQCGLPAVDVERFFGLFGDTPAVVTLFSQGINQSSSGTDKGNAIINCHLLTGRIGREGMGPF